VFLRPKILAARDDFSTAKAQRTQSGRKENGSKQTASLANPALCVHFAFFAPLRLNRIGFLRPAKAQVSEYRDLWHPLARQQFKLPHY
jgi:hypothetical protein